MNSAFFLKENIQEEGWVGDARREGDNALSFHHHFWAVHWIDWGYLALEMLGAFFFFSLFSFFFPPFSLKTSVLDQRNPRAF